MPQDSGRLQRNIAKLRAAGKDDAFIDRYLQLEGADPRDVFAEDKPKPGKDPRIEAELADGMRELPGRVAKYGKKVFDMTPAGAAIQGAENLTGGASEDLLPMIGQVAAGGAAAASGVGAPAAIGAAAAGGGWGEVARQGVRTLRGKPTSTKQFTEDVSKEALLGAAGEGAVQGAVRVLPKLGKLAAGTKFGQTTLAGFTSALNKAQGLGARGRQAVYDVLNFMGDLHPKSVDYVMKRGPSQVFNPQNFDNKVLGEVANDVVTRIDQLGEGASKAYTSFVDNFYEEVARAKYPYAKVSQRHIDEARKSTRFYTGPRVVQTGKRAMHAFGYTDVFGDLKPTVLGELGNKMQEGKMLRGVIDKIGQAKVMTADAAMTLRQEIDDIVYSGWKDPRTKVAIGPASGPAISVLKSIRHELSDRLKNVIKGLAPVDDAFSKTMDIVHRAKPLYKDTITAEKTLRRYNAMSKGHDVFTEAEKQVIGEVDGLIPHSTRVLDHLYAKEFEPLVANFWKSRALQNLAFGAAGGYAAGGAAGAAVAGSAALAASSPRVIRAGLSAAERAGQTASAVKKATAPAVKAAGKAAARAAVPQKAREAKNKREAV